ncbi:MAG: DNA-binding response regulator [Betaproteobacteria bacterium]|nr:DNA-binding response regulator [Betaproteobacteria bacterium]
MQKITVAVVEANQEKRVQLEQSLHQDKEISAIEVLTDEISNKGNVERRLKPRSDLTFLDDIVARIQRIKPRILLLSTQIQQLSGGFCNLLLTLRNQCPETLVVLLIDEEATEVNQLLDALASGARGFLDSKKVNTPSFSKMIKAVDKGEAWVSRKLHGEMMNKILFQFSMKMNEVDFDSTC